VAKGKKKPKAKEKTHDDANRLRIADDVDARNGCFGNCKGKCKHFCGSVFDSAAQRYSGKRSTEAFWGFRTMVITDSGRS
jgi:hypothetical protein